MQEYITPIIIAIFASSGFWNFLTARHTKKNANTKAFNDMLKGLGHDRICYLGMQYLRQGHISQGEYENLYTYLYEPYKQLGGNGTATKLMLEVEKLPFTEDIVNDNKGGTKK